MTKNKIAINPQSLDNIRQDFVILSQKSANQSPLVYLDNAATTQKPKMVTDTIQAYYQRHNANVHRGSHFLSERATADFEQARTLVKQFIHAHSTREIIWTAGTTSAVNLVANSWGGKFLRKGDIILLSEMEHHANIVPWQLIAQRTGAIIKPIGITEHFKIDMDHYQQLLSEKPRLVAISHVSNTLGTINPVEDMVAMAKQAGAVTFIDGAQAMSHIKVDVQQIDCDFYAFSGHKMFGPTGIGVLYGKEGILNDMPPWQGGGEMIERVNFSHSTYNDLPFKFEAGTPNISGAIGLSAAIGYLRQFDLEQLQQHEQQLFLQVYDHLQQQDKIELYCERENNVGIISFNIIGEHHQDIGTLLDQQGIAVRTGHHCTMPLMTKLGINGTIRLSLSLYNNQEDVSTFIHALDKVIDMLQ